MTDAYNVREDNFQIFLTNWTSHFISWISANSRDADVKVVEHWYALLGFLVMQKHIFDKLKKANLPIEEKEKLLDASTAVAVPSIMNAIMPLTGFIGSPKTYEGPRE